MKSKDIRKDNNKKRGVPTRKNHSESLHIYSEGANYLILYDNYSATVYRENTDGAIAIYRAADRSWKIIPDLFSYSIRAAVEKLYS